jgi:uncharacterized beta barrel domain-containing protein DUF5777
MKKIYNILFGLTLLLVFVLAAPAIAQDEKEDDKTPIAKADKPARDAFESAWWFDGQTGKVYNKNTLEFVIQHRFGTINSGNNDVFGIYGPSNIRLGLGYAPIKNLNVGIGYTKNKKILDLNAKYAILTQTRSNSMPVSVTYYGNMGIELQDKENYLNSTDRYNYFNQLIIMKRFNSKFSAQLAPSYTHYNAVKWEQQENGEWLTMENDTWGLSVGARYKVGSSVILMAGYDQPLTTHPINQPKPSINVGIEFSTSSHAFQVFATNNNRIQPQENFMFNQNDFGDGGWLIGFNITRLWSF